MNKFANFSKNTKVVGKTTINKKKEQKERNSGNGKPTKRDFPRRGKEEDRGGERGAGTPRKREKEQFGNGIGSGKKRG